MLRGFIFDLNGVITDTAEYHYRGWKRLADEEGLPFTRKDNEHLRGVSRRDSLLLILKGRTYPEAKLQEMMERKNNFYLEFVREISPRDLLRGARELLEEIQRAGLKTALGSASQNAPLILERLHITALFDVIVDGSRVQHTKPDPEVFVRAALELGVDPHDCVVFEDAAAGIEAARAGGFHTVGLGPRGRVSAADVILPSLANVHLNEIMAKFTELTTTSTADF